MASDSTLHRTITGLGAHGAGALGGAAAQVREQLWADRDRSGPLVAGIDSTLVEAPLGEQGRGCAALRSTPGIEAAIGRVVSEPGRWHNAPKRPRQRKHSRAQVADLTDLADLSDWPERTRLVLRREPRHPGAQRSLFPSDNFRYWGFYSDTRVFV